MEYELDITPEEVDAALKVLKPTGYRLLVALAKVKEKQGSLYIPEARKTDEDAASMLATVIALGPDAYKDAAKFDAPYCQYGDTIMMASYSGRRIKIGDREYRLINDDTVIAVVDEPTKVSRA